MADEGDMSVKAEEEALAIAMAQHQANAQQVQLPPTGFCYYCDEPVPTGHRFCEGEDCRDDYEYEESRRRVQRI